MTEFQITPNSLGVVYLADQDTDQQFELYSAGITGAGGTRFKLSPDTIIPTGDVQDDFQITANSLGVVYRADLSIDEAYGLTGVYINGTSPRSLHPALTTGRTVTDFLLTPNTLGVVFRSDYEVDNDYQLYSTLVTGGEIYPLTHVPAGFSLSTKFEVAPNNTAVVYASNQDDLHKLELFSVPITGGESLKWTAPFQNPEGMAHYWLLLSNSQGLVYLADAAESGRYEAFSAVLGYQVFLPVAQR